MNDNSSMDFYEKPAPKKSKGTGVIIFLLLLIIIGMGGYIAYDKGYLDSVIKKETKTEQKTDEKEKTTTSELKEITDQTVIKTLDRNVEILNLMSGTTWLEKSEVFAKDQKNADLKIDIKLNAVMTYLEETENKEAPVDVTLDEYKRIYKKLFPDDKNVEKITKEDMENEDRLDGLKADIVNSLYKSVFGSEPTKIDALETCPERTYDEVSKKYITISRCGGTCGEQTLTYNYKYEEDDKNAYVYTSVGVEVCSDGIYKDYAKKQMFKEYKEDDFEEEDDFKIDKSNYEQFSKYKITFTKSGNDYVFDSIELLK